MFSRQSSRRRRSLLRPTSTLGGPALMESQEPFLDDGEFDAGDVSDSAIAPRLMSDSEPQASHQPARSASDTTVGAETSIERGLTAFRSQVPAAKRSLLLPESSSPPLELLLQSPDGGAERLRIDESSILVGRGSQCDLRLAHRDVSRRHALLQRVGDRLLVVDLCSRAGVTVGGERVATTWVAPGELLQVGPYALQWHGGTSETAHVEAGASAMQLFARQPIDVDGIDDLGLNVFTEDGELVAGIPLERPITLAGRSPMCKLRLHDESVARVHAGVMLSREGAFAVDLVRRGGLLVNGRAVSRSQLAVGDRLCIGRYRLELVTGLARTMPRSYSRQTAQTVIDTPPVAAMPPMSGGVPETIVMALIGALSDLQRQFHEQSRYQMEVVQRLFESVRVELRDEISQELRRLQELTKEIQATQQQMLRLSAPTQSTSPPTPVVQTAASTPTTVEAPPTTGRPAGKPAADKPANVGTQRASGLSEQEAAFEHAWIAERLRTLEHERASGWEKLRRLLGTGN